jgi:hypothetical protein
MAATKVAGEVAADSKTIGYPPLPRNDFWKYTASMMDVTHVKKILKALQSSASYGEFREKLKDLKPRLDFQKYVHGSSPKWFVPQDLDGFFGL